MVYKVLTDPRRQGDRRACTSIASRASAKEVHARAVLLCAQALESARILLNSATQDPSGLANSSGVLGHYLMDHLWVAGGASGEFPDAPGRSRRWRAAASERHLRDPVPQHDERRAQKDFLRGFGFQGGGVTSFNCDAPGFGAAFKKARPRSG